MKEKRRVSPKRRRQHPGTPNVRGKKIVLASQININRLQPFVDRVLKTLGVAGALVTDESLIADLLDFRPLTQDYTRLRIAAEALGIPILGGDYLHEVAERLRSKEEANG